MYLSSFFCVLHNLDRFLPSRMILVRVPNPLPKASEAGNLPRPWWRVGTSWKHQFFPSPKKLPPFLFWLLFSFTALIQYFLSPHIFSVFFYWNFESKKGERESAGQKRSRDPLIFWPQTWLLCWSHHMIFGRIQDPFTISTNPIFIASIVWCAGLI